MATMAKGLNTCCSKSNAMKENWKDFSTEMLQSLTKYWHQFLLALPRIALAVALLLLVLFIASFISRTLNRRLSTKAHDPLFAHFVSKLIKFALVICGIILFLHVMGLTGIAGGLLAGAGISAFIFGFAFKDIAENFLAGIILAFNRPFAMNDTIKVQDYTGHIIALNFRTTHIKTFDEKDVFIPNAIVVKETLTNLTKDGMIRLDFVVGIAYEDDVEAATQLILDTITPIEGVLQEKEPFAVMEEFATNTVNIRVFFWSATDDYKKGVLITKSNVMSTVKKVLSNQGFTLPANIQELKLYDKRKSIPVSLVNTATPQ